MKPPRLCSISSRGTRSSVHYIRPAVPLDAEALARLRYDFRAAAEPPSEPMELFVPRCAAWMAQRLQLGSNWHCWLYEYEGRPAGQAWLQLIDKLPNPAAEFERHGYITNVYVAPALRGSGAGEALVSEAVSFCYANAVDSVILWPTERSRSLYERFGFAVRDDLMEAQLGPLRHI